MTIELIGASDGLLISMMEHGWELVGVSYDHRTLSSTPTHTLSKTMPPEESDFVEGYVCMDCVRKCRDGNGLTLAITVYPTEKFGRCCTHNRQRARIQLPPR
jgi:hypothetical protein